MPSNEDELLKAARAVVRLQNQIRKFQRNIKVAKDQLRLERKHLRGLASAKDIGPDVMPSRIHGGAVGLKAPKVEKVPATTTELPQLLDDD